jgi:riboflavin synthase
LPSRDISGMFTGIIEEMGTVVAMEPSAGKNGGARLVLGAVRALADKGRLQLGESIAVNGVCLTALEITPESFATDLSQETLERSSLRSLQPGARVNLERAMTPATRFGGHIVQGHVDGVGKLLVLEPLPDGNWWLAVEIPQQLTRYVVGKGSIALNGISLTVANLKGRQVAVAIIPHTYENTVLATMRPGDGVNVECDVIAKHVEKLLKNCECAVGVRKPKQGSTLRIEKLKQEDIS